VSSGDR